MKKGLQALSGKAFQRGQGFVEYGLLLTLVAIGIVLAMSLAGVSISDLYCNAANSVGGGEACKGEETYCQDNFDANTEGWQNVSGKSEIQGSKMCFPSSAQILNKCSTKMKQSDYTIDLNGVTLSKPGRGYGVYFRSTMTEKGLNGYAFQYDPGAGNALLIRRWINGREVTTPISRVPINSTIYDAPHDFKIIAKDSTFTVMMDGAQVMTAQDSTYPTGGVGLRTWDNFPTTCLNNFSISQTPK